MTARYAIYYAPARESRISQLASAWLGRDAFTGEALTRPGLPGLEDLDLDRLTADPRGYGFHATLKAPFELAAHETEDALVGFAESFAAGRTAFEAEIAPAALGTFLAFRLSNPTPAMDDLAAHCVRAFDPYRAPLSDFDLARRRKAPLTPEQDARMVQWGYPYIFEDFRFHMTLTGSIRDEALRGRVLRALEDHLAEVAGPHRFDSVAVFRQADRDAPFQILARLTFSP